MDDQDRLRYSRHLLLDEWTEATQERVASSHALVIGAGGLGAPAVMYLAATGVGRITIVDPDTVDLTNLQRQIVHGTSRIGQPKAWSAREGLRDLNPNVQVLPLAQAADDALLAELAPQAGVILDCTDRFETRHMVNRASRKARVPLVTASALRWDGQIAVFDPRRADSPCYACLFPPDSPPEEALCALMGVFAPVVGMMGVMQAGEAIKLLAGFQDDADTRAVGAQAAHMSLAGRLVLLDGTRWQTTSVKVMRDPACPVCGEGASTPEASTP